MLTNYVLWYNEYQKLWYAIDRNTQVAFFGGKRDESIYLSAKTANELIKKLK